MFVPNHDPTDGEVVLRVSYRKDLRRIWRILILILLGCAGLVGPYFLMLPRGQYMRTIFCVAVGLFAVALGLEVLFTKHILFCHDRAVKVWHFLGNRAIPYNRAKLEGASRLNGVRRGKTYLIMEVAASGRVGVLQVPIHYMAYMVSPEADNQVDAILSYLVGIERNSRVNERRRSFRQSLLTKELA